MGDFPGSKIYVFGPSVGDDLAISNVSPLIISEVPEVVMVFIPTKSPRLSNTGPPLIPDTRSWRILIILRSPYLFTRLKIEIIRASTEINNVTCEVANLVLSTSSLTICLRLFCENMFR